MLECSVKIFGNLTGIFFFNLCIEKEDEHLEIVQVVTECWCQKVLSAGCGYFQEWPHAPGTPQKIYQFDQGWHTLFLKPEVAEWSAWRWEQTASGWHIVGFGQLLVALVLKRPPEAQAGGGTLEQQEVNPMEENTGVGTVQHLGPTSQTSVLRKPLPRVSNSITVIHMFWYFFIKYFWR